MKLIDQNYLQNNYLKIQARNKPNLKKLIKKNINNQLIEMNYKKSNIQYYKINLKIWNKNTVNFKIN